MTGDLVAFVFILIVAFLLMGALSPLEALGWWAGWFQPAKSVPPRSTSAASFQQAIVFLTGIHSVSDESYARREIQFLEKLRQHLPQTLILEVFPYSATNHALTGQRFFSRFWRIALRLKQGQVPLAGLAIYARNIWQVAVSADKRYGPIYNQATADIIARELLEHGYSPDSNHPIILIGYSGGGQIAAGAAGYLKFYLEAPISVISLGGILCADPGLLELKKFYQLSGKKDRLQHLGALFFPGRWPLLGYSPWNQARQKGIIEIIDMGPVDHTGKHGYLDSKATLADGRSFLDQTVDIVVNIVKQDKM